MNDREKIIFKAISDITEIKADDISKIVSEYSRPPLQFDFSSFVGEKNCMLCGEYPDDDGNVPTYSIYRKNARARFKENSVPICLGCHRGAICCTRCGIPIYTGCINTMERIIFLITTGDSERLIEGGGWCCCMSCTPNEDTEYWRAYKAEGSDEEEESSEYEESDEEEEDGSDEEEEESDSD